MAVVFPAPAGAIASCNRAPEVHICRTSAACPASSAVPLAAISSSARSTADASTDGAVAAPGGRHQALLGVEDPLGGVGLGAGDRVDRGAVDPPQHLRFLNAVIRRGQRHRSAVQHLIDQQIDQGVGALGGDVGGADLALGFGPDMPHLPGRAVLLHRGQHPVGRLGHPRRVDRLPWRGSGGHGPADHGFDRTAPAQHLLGFGPPGRSLLGQRPRFVLRLPGLQGGLLGQVQRFDRGRWPAMILLEGRPPARRGGR